MTNAEFYLEDLKTKFRKINPKNYYLSYSGGRDSHLLYWFIKKYAPEFKDIEIVGLNTGMEFKEILDRIYKYSDKILLPSLPISQVKEKYGIPCFSKEQDFYIYYYQNSLRKGKKPATTVLQKIEGGYKTGFNISKKAREYVLSGNAHNITHLCCYYLKKKPFHDYEKQSGKKAILGVKGSESELRKRQYTSCFSQNGKFTPLWDLTDKLENEIYEQYNIELPLIYNEIERTGCIACPYGSYKGDTKKELKIIKEQNLKQYEFVKELFKESYKILGVEND